MATTVIRQSNLILVSLKLRNKSIITLNVSEYLCKSFNVCEQIKCSDVTRQQQENKTLIHGSCGAFLKVRILFCCCIFTSWRWLG